MPLQVNFFVVDLFLFFFFFIVALFNVDVDLFIFLCFVDLSFGKTRQLSTRLAVIASNVKTTLKTSMEGTRAPTLPRSIKIGTTTSSFYLFCSCPFSLILDELTKQI